MDDAIILLVRHVRDVEEQEVGIANDIRWKTHLVGGVDLDIWIKELEFALPIRMSTKKRGFSHNCG